MKHIAQEDWEYFYIPKDAAPTGGFKGMNLKKCDKLTKSIAAQTGSFFTDVKAVYLDIDYDESDVVSQRTRTIELKDGVTIVVVMKNKYAVMLSNTDGVTRMTSMLPRHAYKRRFPVPDTIARGRDRVLDNQPAFTKSAQISEAFKKSFQREG